MGNGAIVIPKANEEKSNFPCWIAVKNESGEERRPYVKCKCGQVMGVGNHHVHANGELTRSFYHSHGPSPCGFHEYLIFEGYDGSEWLPGKSQQEKLKDFD